MGRVLLIARLAAKDLRHRPAQAMLLLLAITAGSATLTLGLALPRHDRQPLRANPGGDERTGRRPDRLHRRRDCSWAGGHCQAGRHPWGQRASDHGKAAALLPLANARGVAAHSGPFPVTWTTLHMGNTSESAEVEGRSPTPSSVDQPKLLHGSWPPPAGGPPGLAPGLGFFSLRGPAQLGGTTPPRLGGGGGPGAPPPPPTFSPAAGGFLGPRGVSFHPPGVVGPPPTFGHLPGPLPPASFFFLPPPHAAAARRALAAR